MHDVNSGSSRSRTTPASRANATNVRTPGTQTSAASNLTAKHLFDLKVQTVRTALAEVDGGYRVDVEYSASGSPIHVAPNAGLGALATIMNAATLDSGSDWLFVSADGVMSFDSRLTFRCTDKVTDHTGEQLDVHCFITARLRGKANLSRLRHRKNQGYVQVQNAEEGLTKWKENPSDCTFPVVFSIVIDVPSSGFDSEQDAVLKQLRVLSSDMFIGHGTASGDPSSSTVTKVDVNVYRIS